MLYRTLEAVERFGRRALAVVLFGSCVYSPRRARDVDLLVIVDELRDFHEKVALEVEVSRSLHRELRRAVDVVVLDLESFRENLAVGTFLSGLVLGYRVLYDAIGVDKLLEELFSKLADEDYVYVKGRRWNLSAVARAKLRWRRASSDGGLYEAGDV